MRGGIKALLVTGALTGAGCSAHDNDFKIRAVADPLTKAMKPGSSMIEQAQALLALNNVGLAIEAYRKALRSQPDSMEAMAGLAECYDRMGRHDLARAKYEAALAIAPDNPVLLRTFAASLERQGRLTEAQSLRSEADRSEAAVASDLVRSALNEAAQASSTPRPPLIAAPASPAPVPRPVAQKTEVQPPAVPAAAGSTAETKIKAPAPRPSVGSIAVKLPPLTLELVETVLAAPASNSLAPPPRPQPRNPARTDVVAAAIKPRLERLSLGEVALVTSPKRRWKAEAVQRTALSSTVRFVPLKPEIRVAGVRLLNAARHEGLAARTRTVLSHAGWSRVSIGDAARVRQKSLVLYSMETAEAARHLATKLRLPIAKDPRPGPLTILLGRDAVARARFGS